jgi:hypothetical protein
MALINATSFAGFLLLLYLSSFFVFAILRITTGISIQRIGYWGFRHIAYTPKEGIRIDIRGVGLSFHRPTFAQPTWVSLRLTELKLTVDPASLRGSMGSSSMGDKHDTSGQDETLISQNDSGRPRSRTGGKNGRSQLWRRLTDIKDRIKRVHRKIHWLRMLDIVALNSSVEVVGVGSVQVAAFTMAVHTRRKLLDRGRLFRHKKDPSGNQRPAEWIFTVRTILLSVSGNEAVEIVDGSTVNIHGILYAEREGLRDTSIAIKVARLHVPLHEILTFADRFKSISSAANAGSNPTEKISVSEVMEELDQPGSREASIVQAVADSKEFVSSTLQSVQEIQLAMSFIRISNEIEASGLQPRPLILNVVTHEIGIDLHKLDQATPAHRMYFSPKDVAHQALVAAISISVSLDEDESSTNKIMYIPMATTTIRTTLPSKTMSFSDKQDVAERNTNILFANFVVTSPSIDLEPRHLIQLLALTQKQRRPAANHGDHPHRLISRLLPKASIRLSIHEPVVRFVLPVHDKLSTTSDYDMIICAISSISLDIESSHSGGKDLLYSLGSNFRMQSLKLYYQAASGTKHNLVLSESLELRMQLNASNEVLVVISGNLRSFSVLMVREEVSGGIYNIVRHFKRTVQPDKLDSSPETGALIFLRKLPAWLLDIHFEGHDCSIETAGVDKSISNQTRGLALQLETWSAAYQSQKTRSEQRPSSRRHRSSSTRSDEAQAILDNPSTNSPSKQHPHAATDGRRLAIHVKNLEGFIIESLERWEKQPFLSLPRLEVAFSTSRDLQGPIFHVNSAVRAIYLQWSLYRFYSIGVAGSILKDAFLGPPAKADASAGINAAPRTAAEDSGPPQEQSRPAPGSELVTIDVKAGSIHVKATMPHEPRLLFQIYEVAAGRHRWSAPFLRSSLIRLHAEAPYLKSAWARILSMNNIRIDLRQSRKKFGNSYVEDKSVDISTDFVRLSVPHGLLMYRVFDNFVNTNKAFAQLSHRFKTRTNEYILSKMPEGPKHVPRIAVRSKALMFELEDDPFEWKLGTIYHIGQVEQKQRLAREEAFKVKARRLKEDLQPRSSSRIRTQSHRPSSRERQVSPSGTRSKSQDSHNRKRSTSRGRRRKDGHTLRYARDGVCALTTSFKIDAQAARQKLQEHNARSWKKRIDGTLALQNKTVRSIRQMFSGADEPPHDIDENETIVEIPNRPGLMSLIISDLHLIIDKPSFPTSEVSRFIHDIGKGMPLDMQYSLLVPMSISMDMGETRAMLRDYPLNLLHIPAIRPGQPPRLPSWSLRTDFVIAEEFRDEESSRHIKVDIVPKGLPDENGDPVPGFAIDVRRTVSPVKTYSKPVIDINTSLPTTISWGTSYQPVIQDMMMIIEGFTKPEIDASERVGFWDKIRMSFHSRPVICWKGDGDVQLRLKGSRDPYIVVGYGAGFVMCWRNDVEWAVHANDDPRQFMTISSGEYVLAIPDYSHQARKDPEAQHDGDSMSSGSSSKNAAVFKKVIMKVTGNVQWTAGLVFERDLKGGGRSFDFEPHYNVILKNPQRMSPERLKDYDAFRGFRSNHIHLSIGVAAPFDRDWTASGLKPADSYNTVHLSPRFFSHFFDWWHLFSGVMSLPVRQGRLWRSPDKTSKKFGRHLATIKYKLLLSPLFIAHVYKHKEAEDYKEDVVSATGLKLRIDSFMLDLHQRREYFDTLSKSRGQQTRTSAMKMNRAELDFVSADLRAVAASIGGTTAEDLAHATEDTLASYQEPPAAVDMSSFTIPDHDFSWIDMDDFVELDWVLPSESNPDTKILPLAFTPRFTYFRQTDHGNSIAGDEKRTSPFGDENSHGCVMSKNNDPRKVQMDLVSARLEKISAQLKAHQTQMSEQELKVIQDTTQDQTLKETYESMLAQEREIILKRRFLENGLRRLANNHAPGEMNHETTSSRHESSATSASDLNGAASSSTVDMDGLFSAQHDEFAVDFNNRFIIHNAQFKWNNSLRNILLRYSHQVSQRRGFVYYMSRRAVKFIIDIVEEQSSAKKGPMNGHHEKNRKAPAMPTVMSPTEEKDEDVVVQDRIEQLLKDAKQFVHADESAEKETLARDLPTTAEIGEKIADEFLALNSYHVRAIAPQIQMQSEKNPRSVVLVSAKGMQFQVVSIMDKSRMSDDVSGLVQRRFALDMDGAQFFVTAQKRLAKYLHLYSGNRYGNPPHTSWPPWVSLEVMFDFHLNPFGFQRVIQRTSASLRYEKYNPLRLKYNEQIESGEPSQAPQSENKESRIDHLWVDFPRIRASCDSAQYYAMYIIVFDLLLYSEPLEKTRSERLEKIMLASDFSDLRGAPEMATSLQERIRQLEDIKLHFQVNAKYLDRQGWQDRIHLEKDLANCEDELFFIMKAITTSQHKNDDRKSSESSGLLRWYLSASEIVWHLMREKNEPLVEFQLGNAAYERVDNSDGSNYNAMAIEHIRGLNLLSSALYPEMIGPYFETAQPNIVDEHKKMVQIHWHMLEAIAGIPVLEQFRVTMHPLKVQLERELGKKLFEYIFPGVGSTAFDNGNFSPLMVKNMEPLEEDEDSEGEHASNVLAPDVDTPTVSQEDLESLSTGAIGQRLQPTFRLNHKPTPSPHSLQRPKGLGISSSEHHLRVFKHLGNSDHRAALSQTNLPRKASASSLRSLNKKLNGNSSTNLTALTALEDKKRNGVHRSASKDHRSRRKDKKAKPSDDLTQMMSRASNYMTLAHVKLDSFVICLSYKGKSERNIEDLHDFVFRMPVLQYRNKTWSNLDLALRLKKDVIRAIISHTGAIIGNKFSHHRPNKQQQSRLRELVSNSAILPNSEMLVNTASNSETTSLYSEYPAEEQPDASRQSFQSNSHSSSAGPSPLLRNDSFQSIQSMSGSLFNRDSGPAIPVMSRPHTSDAMSTIRAAVPPHRSLLQNTLGRHFTRDERSNSVNSKGEGEDSDPETHKKKSVLLLGKKILGSLS